MYVLTRIHMYYPYVNRLKYEIMIDIIIASMFWYYDLCLSWSCSSMQQYLEFVYVAEFLHFQLHILQLYEDFTYYWFNLR